MTFPTRQFIFGALYATVVLASTHASALTLGRLQGAALLGKELDVIANVQVAPDEDIAPNCFDATVHFGETLVERSRVSVQFQAGSQPGKQVVRISTNARVEDAVVTIDLKTQCAQRTSRRYVLLADVVSETSGPAAGFAPSVATAIAPAEKAPASQPVVSPNEAAAPKSTPQLAKPVAKSAKVTSAPAAKPAPAVVAETAKPSLPAQSAAIDELQRRVESIEQWQAKSSVTGDSVGSGEKANALQADIQGLKLIMAKNQQNLQTLASAVESADSQSFGRSLLYALAALLAACLAALAFVINKVRQGSMEAVPWWLGGDQRDGAERTVRQPLDAHEGPHSISLPSQLLEPIAEGDAPVTVPTETALSQPVDLDIGQVTGTPSAQAPASEASTPAAPTNHPLPRIDFANSVPGQPKAINTKEMLDIRQQAEFFMALGQHDEAVSILESSIRDSDDANPLVYLDLLKLFHTLSRRADFERYREEFNLQFTGRIPSYTDFLMEGNGIEAYEDICQQIVVLWPSEYTVDFIEQCLVRMPEDDPEQGIDLEAFKDLLLLYGVLKRLDQASDSGLIPFSASRTAPNSQLSAVSGHTSLPAYAEYEDAGSPATYAVESNAGASAVDFDLDLDLDLDAAPPPHPDDKTDNLIDFDMSGYNKSDAGNKPG